MALVFALLLLFPCVVATLYDLVSDPAETVDVAVTNRRELAQMRALGYID